MPTDVKYLREFPCFRSLTDQQLETIAPITTAVCYPADYVLFEEDQPGDRLFFLLRGKIEVDYNIGEAGQVRVDTIFGNDVAGCSALVSPYTYTATERSLTEVEVLEVDAKALRDLMHRDCQFGMALQDQLIAMLMDRILNLRLELA